MSYEFVFCHLIFLDIENYSFVTKTFTKRTSLFNNFGSDPHFKSNLVKTSFIVLMMTVHRNFVYKSLQLFTKNVSFIQIFVNPKKRKEKKNPDCS